MATSVESNFLTVSAMYDFLAAGPGTFTFDPVPRFQVVGSNNIIETNMANTHSVSITITDGAPKRELSLRKRDIVVCSDSKQAQYISDALNEAISLIREAAKYIVDKGPHSHLYKAYFGSHDPFDVHSIYNAIAEPMGPIPLACSDSSANCGRNYCFFADDKVYFCDAFFTHTSRLDLTCDETTVSRGGTVIREVALGLGLVNELAVGCDKVKELNNNFNAANAGNFEVRLWPVVC